MPIRLAVNGFGRIGRYLIRLLADASDVEIVAVNARADNATLAHLLKYDSTFGPFPFPVSATENGIMVNGRGNPRHPRRPGRMGLEALQCGCGGGKHRQGQETRRSGQTS